MRLSTSSEGAFMADNGAAAQTLAGWINMLRSANGIVKDAAQALAPVVKAEIEQAIAEGRSVDGQKWPLTKAGHVALRNAAKNITVRAIDNVILVTLSGHHVFHHFGAGRNPRRAILPTRGMPAKLGDAIRKGLVDMGHEWMTRAGRHDKGSRGVKMRPGMKA